MISYSSLFLLATGAWALPSLRARQTHETPTVELAYGTVVGSPAVNGVESFKGIPFAEPPTGPLRLKPPQPINTYRGTINATGVPAACPQFTKSTNPANAPMNVPSQLASIVSSLGNGNTTESEDCLTLNIQRPGGTFEGENLPVLFWIYGGGFEDGSTQTYDATQLIQASLGLGKNILYVSVNYRVAGWGFMPGKEILADGASNLGLLDQRLGLQWVADNIQKFGGDPNKVTIWGESAGSISVANQLLLYNGENAYNGRPLFRAAIMDSGSIIPADTVDCPKGQAVYDTVVKAAGCQTSTDTLACLRALPEDQFKNAANSVPALFSYLSTDLAYEPRPDGVVLTQSPDVLVKNGLFAKVPFIIGDQEDEGTLFSLTQDNITTTDQVVDYLGNYFVDAPRDLIQTLVNTYPDDPAAGSPFRTGTANNLYPQYKRLAAILGDLAFTLTRRTFLSGVANITDLPTWSYLASYNYGFPYLGTYHSTDIARAYGTSPGFSSSATQAYYLSFINTLDPNNGTTGYATWPRWSQGQQLLNLNSNNVTIINDDFRAASYNFIVTAVGQFRT